MNLTKIADGLRLIADGLEDGVATPAKPSKPSKPSKPDKTAPPPADDDGFDDAVDTPAVSKEDVIQALQGVMKAKGRAALDKILKDFNVASVGALDAGDYADVIENAKAAVAG